MSEKCEHCGGMGMILDYEQGTATPCVVCMGTGDKRPQPQSLARFACGLQLEEDDEDQG